MQKQFKQRTNTLNQILRINKNVYVSFNDKINTEIGLFASDKGLPETALVIDKSFLILNGDFREQYLEAAQSDSPVEACIKVFKNNKKKFQSSWSNAIPANYK